MKATNKRVAAMLKGVALLIAVIMAAGCGEFEPPTVSQEPVPSHGDLWNPQPGDEIVPGQEVPLVDPGYWGPENGPTINPRNSSSRRIGPSGGTVYLDHHYYTIPEGAVFQQTTFTLSYASYNGIAVDCGPSPFQFNEPVTISLSYHNTQYDDGELDPSNLHVYYMDTDGSLIMMPSTVDEDNETVNAVTDHFSRYILG